MTDNITPASATHFFKITVTEPQHFKVITSGQIRRGDVGRQMLVLLPEVLDKRLKEAVSGAMGSGVVGLLEFALDTLEREKKSLIVEN